MSSGHTLLKRIGILVSGSPSDALRPLHGDYFEMFSKLLNPSPTQAQFEFERIQVEGGLATPPRTKEERDRFDGFLITGSKFDAHDDATEWIVSLREFIRAAHAEKRPILGVCFGHQIVAHSLGGVSGRATAAGWEIGVRELQNAPGSPFSLPSGVFISESHRDQVSQLPPDATHVASSLRCPHEMFTIEPNVLCMQGHPEFSPEYSSSLIKARLEMGTFDEKLANDALHTIDTLPTSTTYFRSLMTNFLLGKGFTF